MYFYKNFISMIKILITGGAGNVGGALARKLVEKPTYFVVVVDNLSTGSKSKLPSKEFSNWSFINCDVNNYTSISEIMLVNQFDYVFHYAAVVGVKRTQENPIMVLDDIQGIKNVLQLSKNSSVKRAFFSSSSEVYGEPVELPQNEETTPLNSRVPYAVVKNVGESFFRSYFKTYGLPFTIFRFFNTYGPNQSEDFVIAKFLKAALKGDDITIYGDGSQTRTFCYVDDNINTCLKILEDNLMMNDVINIGGAKEYKILDVSKLIIEKLNSKSKIIHYFKTYGLPFTIFRFFNTYGPNQSEDFVIAKFLKAALKGDDITIYGDGSQTRTFCYVDDNINTCLKILEDNLMMNDVINIGGAKEYKILDVSKLIIEKLNSKSKIIHLPALKDGDMTRRMPDNSKMLNIIDKELISLDQGLDLMLQHPHYSK